MRTAFREWRVRWDPDTGPVLQSMLIPTLWPEATLTSNGHGIYACLPWCESSFLTKPFATFNPLKLSALGAVDLQGRVVEHVDGVVRAEKMRVLALRLVGKKHDEAPCGHNEYYAVSGIDKRFWALRQKCAPTYGCDGYSKVMAHEAPYNVPNEIKMTLSVPQIEQALLERYEVARLPDKEGPWLPPWGSGEY